MYIHIYTVFMRYLLETYKQCISPPLVYIPSWWQVNCTTVYHQWSSKKSDDKVLATFTFANGEDYKITGVGGSVCLLASDISEQKTYWWIMMRFWIVVNESQDNVGGNGVIPDQHFRCWLLLFTWLNCILLGKTGSHSLCSLGINCYSIAPFLSLFQ